MKFRSLISVLTTSAVTVGSITLGSISAQAGSVSFVCKANSNGTPTTFAKTDKGEREFIRWVSDEFTLAGYTPQARCEQVTNRMNKYISSGSARYITHGTMNRQPVICVTNQRGSGCTDLLYTLRSGQNGRETVEQLLVLNRENFKGDPRLEGTSCRTYVDINGLIQGSRQRAEVVCNSR